MLPNSWVATVPHPPQKKNEGILNQPLAACYILQPINTFKVHVGSLFNGHRDEERQEKGQP